MLSFPRKKWKWLRAGLEPTTRQMACHALTNWVTDSPSNSVAEFEYLSLSCQGSSRSGYQAGMLDGEGLRALSARHRLGQVPWVPILSITRITAGLCHQRLVHEITRFTTRCSQQKIILRGKVGVDSVPIPEFAVYHDPFFDPFFDPFPNSFRVLVLSGRKLPIN